LDEFFLPVSRIFSKVKFDWNSVSCLGSNLAFGEESVTFPYALIWAGEDNFGLDFEFSIVLCKAVPENWK